MKPPQCYLQKKIDINELDVSTSSLPFKIWVKYGNAQPSRVVFDGGDVDDLKEVVKKRLSPRLNETALHWIILHKHGDETDLEPGAKVDSSFQNTAKNPLQVIAIVPEEEHKEQGN